MVIIVVLIAIIAIIVVIVINVINVLIVLIVCFVTIKKIMTYLFLINLVLKNYLTIYKNLFEFYEVKHYRKKQCLFFLN